MRRIFAFIMTTVDGYYVGADGAFDWPVVDAEFEEFAVRQLDDSDTLLFGRRTYEGMAAYWPTEAANKDQNDQRIIDQMNGYPKLVVSQTLERADWAPTTVVADLDELAAIKQGTGRDIALIGSPALTASLIGAGLLDELRVMVNPVALGAGESLFAGIADRIRFELLRTRTFDSGNVLHTYRPL
ncbi:MAG TPA: dihydrofolate reductase family protein [Kribbellaceae bacterium]